MKSTNTKKEMKKNVRRRYSYGAKFNNDDIELVCIEGDKSNIVSVVIHTKNYQKGFEVRICDDCGVLAIKASSVYDVDADSTKHYCEKCTDKMNELGNMIKERDAFLKSTKK